MTHSITFAPRRKALQDAMRGLAICAGFFVFAVVFLLDDSEARLFFSAVFLLFVAIGGGLYYAKARSPRFPLVLDAQGIHTPELFKRYYVETIPWSAIAGFSLFRGHKRVGSFLRIRLQEGSFKDGLRKPADIGFGHDVNILLDFEEDEEAILQAAQELLERHGNKPAEDK